MIETITELAVLRARVVDSSDDRATVEATGRSRGRVHRGDRERGDRRARGRAGKWRGLGGDRRLR